jgi:uncharacterized oligopeptide transporter (OPT) family protein
VGDIIGVFVAAGVMFVPLMILHQGTPGGIGGPNLAAPQASLMAMLAQGIVTHQMAWPLVIVGMIMAVVMICVQVRSPMLVCVGMYLSFGTSAAIFVGGIIRAIVEALAKRRNLNAAQRVRMDNNGVLLAAGLIAGEALMGLVIAALAFKDIQLPKIFGMVADNPFILLKPSYLIGILIFVVLGFILVRVPLANAGSPDEPAPPAAMA